MVRPISPTDDTTRSKRKASPTPTRLVGIDIGGTFTDVVVVDLTTGEIATEKVLTSHQDLVQGVLQALRAVAPDLTGVGGLIHGTTIATNALLQRRGPRCGMITTRGFRDVVEIRRRDRPTTYGLRGSFEPIIPRYLRLEVDERTNARGEVEQPVFLEQVTAAAKHLREQGAEAVVIAFMNSYANPKNEQQAKRAVEQVWPNQFVTASIEVYPAFREFERWVTASANSFVQPVIGTYLNALEGELEQGRFRGSAYVMQSNGGAMSLQQARQVPVNTILSGPAGGVTAAIRLAQTTGHHNLISCDMGGTSFDVCLIVEGRARIRSALDLEYGMPLQIPAVDLITIGAGGGTIAWIDRAGILRVGPQSAGSDPGPASYGRGGSRPTVTDAHVVLGRIATGSRLGGGTSLVIDGGPAADAIQTHVAGPLEMDVEEAALAILKVANARLAGAVKRVSIERGHDPREFALVMFGGAGPLHCRPIMEELEIPTAIVPFYPGLTSALGCAAADFRHDFVTSVNRPVDRLTAGEIQAIQHRHRVRGEQLVAAEAGLAADRAKVLHEADASYTGQTHTLRVEIPAATRDPDHIVRAFHCTYEKRFGHRIADARIWIANLTTTVTAPRDAFSTRPGRAIADRTEAGQRRVRFDADWMETPVYDRIGLNSGERILGPAVLQQPDSTTVVEPGYVATVDRDHNLVLRTVQ